MELRRIMNPKISIAIATYNGASYLFQQLDSLVKQTVAPYEVIICDDNSTDNTLEIAKSFEKVLPLKIYKNSTNLGFTKNFEEVLKKTSGEFILPCDQDDTWENTKVETLLAGIGKNSLVYSDSLLVDETGTTLGKTLSQKLKNNFLSSSTALHFLYDNSVSAHAMMFKRELLDFIFPFPKQSYFDAYIAATAASLHGVVYIDKTLVHYRQHTNNTLGNKQKKKSSLLEKFNHKHTKKLQENNEMLQSIEEFLTIKTLKLEEKQKLQKLYFFYQGFEKRWFSFSMFWFLYANKETFFAITNRNRFTLSIKKSIGYKLYKVAPFL